MRIITTLLILGCLFLFGSCHKVTVGYLYTDEAEYPVNKMEIYNIPAKIAELRALLAEFNKQAASLKTEYERLNAISTEKIAATKSYYQKVMEPVEDSLKMVSLSEEKKQQLQKRLEEITPVYEAMVADRDAAEQAAWEAQKAVDDMASKMGIDSPLLVEKQIAELEMRILYKAPWTTSVIQGVLGTEPLIYEIAGVKNENTENADKFSQYLTVKGGGRLQVDQEVDVPAGEYIVSVKVSTEERERVFTDVFTFIVK